ETLVAVGILAVAVIGALTAAQSGISSSIFSKNQVIAFYLAQEGVEKIRSVRDENSLNGRSWLEGIAHLSSDPCYFGSVCYADTLGPVSLTRCSGGAGSCPTLKQDAETGFYGYDLGWTETIFKREIAITSINENENEISILVTIDWSKGIINRQFRVRENILNWQ
ncbi:MAG: hypothetical protein AAB690_02285, partial [Patescibacteria group bacterium]